MRDARGNHNSPLTPLGIITPPSPSYLKRGTRGGVTFLSFLLALTLTLTLAVSAFGAAYTSSGSGDFNNAATWGGGGWPSAAGDTFTVAASHTVTITNVNTQELGASSISGLLTFSPSATTELRFGNATLTGNNGGELRMGASGAVINKAYTATLGFNTTSDRAQGILVNSGGKLTAYGDPDYYGSSDNTTLYSNWTSGSTLYIVGDYSTKWISGQEIYIHKGTAYSSWTTDTFKGTINGTPTWDGTKTTVVISEAHPGGTFYAGGMVVNASRNVRIQKVGASTAIGDYNSNRPYIQSNNQSTTTVYVDVNDAIITGFSSNDFGYNARFNNTTMRNCSTFMNAGYISYGMFGTQMTGVRVISNNQWGYSLVRNNIDAMFLGNNAVFGNCSYLTVSGKAWGNNTIVLQVLEKTIVNNHQSFYNNYSWQWGDIEFNNSSFNNTNIDFRLDAWYGLDGKYLLRNPSGSIIVYGRNSNKHSAGVVLVEHYNQTYNDHRKYDAFGDIFRDATVTRTGGASASIKVTPLSNCSADNPVQILGKWIEDNVPASSQTRSIKIKGTGWSSYPTAAQLYFEAEYFNSASAATTTTAVSTAVLTDNTTWVDFPVTFTPARAGKVVYRAYIKTYTASAYASIDAAMYREGKHTLYCTWLEGECHIQSGQEVYGVPRSREVNK